MSPSVGPYALSCTQSEMGRPANPGVQSPSSLDLLAPAGTGINSGSKKGAAGNKSTCVCLWSIGNPGSGWNCTQTQEPAWALEPEEHISSEAASESAWHVDYLSCAVTCIPRVCLHRVFLRRRVNSFALFQLVYEPTTVIKSSHFYSYSPLYPIPVVIFQNI